MIRVTEIYSRMKYLFNCFPSTKCDIIISGNTVHDFTKEHLRKRAMYCRVFSIGQYSDGRVLREHFYNHQQYPFAFLRHNEVHFIMTKLLDFWSFIYIFPSIFHLIVSIFFLSTLMPIPTPKEEVFQSP